MSDTKQVKPLSF